MQGYVLTFHSGMRSGTLVTDTGETLAFTLPPSDRELHGGDVVVFELEPGSRSSVPGGPACLKDWELVGSGDDQFAAFRNPIVKALYQQYRVDQPRH